jgi:hypothetical protein
MEPIKILELGAGTGLSGIYLSQYLEDEVINSSVTVTDLPELMPLLEANCESNSANKSHSSVVASELAWGVDDALFSTNSYDYIIGADIVASLYDPILLSQTLHTLATASTKIYVSFKGREKSFHDSFEEGIRERFGCVEIRMQVESRNKNPGVGIIVISDKR